MKLLFWASIGFIGGAMNYLPWHGIEVYPIGNFLIPAHSILVTYAILKHQFLDIEVVIKRGLAYSLSITIISLTYLTAVILFERLLQGFLGYTALSISIFIAFILGIGFIPLKNNIQSLIDRLFYHRSHDEILKENILLKQELLKSEKLKSVATLASGMAHEIKNPLTAIRTFTEYLPQRLNDKDFLNKFSRIVGKEVDQIDEIVHDLLNFAKPSPLKTSPTDVHKLIDDTLNFLNSQFLKSKIKIKKNYASNPSALAIDSKQFRQALLNIILNSIESMKKGGTLTVETQNSSPSKFTIILRDTGSGIDKDALPHIFDPFYTRKDEGTGLGLSITHSIIDQHKATIRVNSEVRKGTEFILELPLKS